MAYVAAAAEAEGGKRREAERVMIGWGSCARFRRVK